MMWACAAWGCTERPCTGVSLHAVNMPGMIMHKTWHFYSGNKLIFWNILGKNDNVFSSIIHVVESFYADPKIVSD